MGTNVITSDVFLAELNRRGMTDKNQILETLVRRELLFAEAQKTGFDKSPEMREAWRSFLINRFAEKQQKRLEELPSLSADELEAYYQTHLDRFQCS
ncbi:MAG: hypothetical protein WDM76_10260 [Limisphaerales bacterium]